MNFRPQQQQDVEINLTPLIDVVFLLLIFFMVSTTFERESEINITLPEASEKAKELEVDVVEISIDGRGRIYVSGRVLLDSGVPAIKQAIAQAAEGMDEPPIIINADAEARHQSVVKVMDAARQLGLRRLSFMTQIVVETDDSQ
ncbi:MAG: biopolymer transporter ExbD [Gammaproteobacteria bacterium]|nr:biopolymer transporter ExbD [Gammaproteobacteria bacterium]